MPSIIKRDVESLSYRVYVTDTLQAIAENTAPSAAYLTRGKSGKAMSRRWWMEDKPAKKETRTAEEIIEHIRNGLKEVSSD